MSHIKVRYGIFSCMGEILKCAKKLSNNNKFGISIWHFCVCRCSFLAWVGLQVSNGDWWTEEYKRAILYFINHYIRNDLFLLAPTSFL